MKLLTIRLPFKRALVGVRRFMCYGSTVLFAGALLACGAQAFAQGTSPGAPAATASPSADANNQSPTDIVQAAAQGMLKELDADRAAFKKDPAKVADLVNKYLLPHFDTEYSARLVLGRFWRTATPDQRKRFVDAFYHSLLANYGNALTDFTADRLKILSGKVEPGSDKATVRTEVKRDNGDRISVNYAMHKTPEGWKAWDVAIDGISYVNSYREDFGPQIEQQGIDSVIARLEKGDKPGQIAKTAGGKT
jgi:phospholipid transport system substrate-binding protein